jgi:hypothetical protein
MRVETLEADIVRELRKARLARQAQALRERRAVLAANAALWMAGGMCGLAVVIFMAAFVGLLPA